MKKSLKYRLLAGALCFAAVLPLLCGCKGGGTQDPPPDNTDDEEEEPYMYHHKEMLTAKETFDIENGVCVLSSDDAVKIAATGLEVNTDIVDEGSRYSGRWANHTSKNTIYFRDFPRDISDADVVAVRMYSAKATNAKFAFVIPCQDAGGKTAYKLHYLYADFTGWKTVFIPLYEMVDGYGADLSKVSGMNMTVNGWNMVADPETELYIDSVSVGNMAYEYSFDPEEIGEYNYDCIINTLVDFQTGGIPLNEAEGDYLNKITSFVNSAKSSRSRLRRVEGWDMTIDKDPMPPFAADMSTTAGISTNYSNIYNMARGYAVEGSELYHDEELLDDILYALNYMHVNYYNDKNLRTYPSRNNWWDWEIGSAQSIVNILMLIKDGLTQRQIDIYLAPVNKYVPLPSMTMANRVDLAYVTIAAGALQQDYFRIMRSRDMLDECCLYVSVGDGFYTDGSFVQHDIIAYTGSYGPIMLEALSKQIIACSDTCFRFGEYMLNNQCSWTIDSFTPLMYHGAFFGLVRGRSICRTSSDVSLGLSAIQGMLRMTKYVTDPEKCHLIKSMIKEYNEYSGAYYHSALSPFDLKILDELIADDSVAPRTDFAFAKVFGMMDRPIAQLEKYGVGISLSSSRIAKYEAINEENGKGWYTGDGMLYIYTTVSDYDPTYWKNVNYYRIPGTTVTTVPRVDQNINAANTLSQYDFVGGVTLGKNMVAAMQFETATAKMSFRSDLNGKKAWFVFDDEIVCLGAGISCSDRYDTETIIENRRLAANGSFKADGVEVSGKSGVLTGKTSLYVENFGGVYLPGDKAVSFARTDKNFLELYFNHGKNISSDTYSYVLLPTMTADEVTAYAAAPGIEILSNTPDCQVVRDKSTGAVGYVFWKAGTFGDVTVSAPCTLLISGGTVACSDPTMKVSDITVTVNGAVYAFTGLYDGRTETITK